MSLETLRLEIKTWEYSFAKTNKGRKPSAEDVKQNKEISLKYKQYHRLRKQDQDPEPHDEPHDEPQHTTPVKLQPSLGPTPQMDGKVLGIFEVKGSPTEMTPTKPKGDVFKTPSKRHPKRGLSTPKSEARPPVETPLYLKHQLTPSGSPGKYVEASPLMFSPSRRFIKTKSLFQMSQELDAIEKEKREMEMDEDIRRLIDEENGLEDEETENNEENVLEKRIFKRAKTQKRSTKRVKLKTSRIEEKDKLENVDIQQRIRQIEGIEEMPSESESSEEEQKKGRVSKRPLNDNYVRMKIHHKGRFGKKRRGW